MTSTIALRSIPNRVDAATIAACLLMVAALTACGKNDDGKTAGQKLDAAVANTERAAAEAKAKAESSMAKAGDAMKDATQKAESAGVKSTEKMAGTVDDLAITASVASELAKDADLSAIKIDVDTKAGVVTLYGPAPSAAARDKATAIAKQIKGVTSVDNKLVVKVG
jgi:hyperosmotically inducible periplasmic protein